MFFVLSKVLWGLCAPSHVIAWCAVLAAVLLLTGRRRAGAAFTFATAFLVIVVGIIPSYILLDRSLDDRIKTVALPAHADGILVLAGGWDEDVQRIATAYTLARRYPQAHVVFSGGSGLLLDNTPDIEAGQARRFFAALGLEPDRLTTEGRSRNTYENFAFTKAQVRPRVGEVWILVTSGFHMPRAMAIADKLGWRFVPYPSSYLTRHGLNRWEHWFDIPDNLNAFDIAAREQIGLLAYRLSGRSSG